MQNTRAVLAALLLLPAGLYAQFGFDIGTEVQVHSFASQGFAYSNQNNYLTMGTSRGSFALTDGGLNLSTDITDNFRIGAQAYARNIGELGNGQVQIDWALADYRIKDWFGVRAGKVKTALGLYNDTQDMEFIHTWAILPQSVYPLDLRAATIAHLGGDVYGEVPLKKLGSLSYTAYAGRQPVDKRGGYFYNNEDAGTPVSRYSAIVGGGDARWTTPLQGLMVGISWMKQDETTDGFVNLPFGKLPYRLPTESEHHTSTYIDFARGRWRLTAEGRRHYGIMLLEMPGRNDRLDISQQGWFASAAFRVAERLEIGTYHSRYWNDVPHTPGDKASTHLYDQTITARVDLTKFWNVKVEGHFIDGYGDSYSARGFYKRNNPGGMKSTTNLLVLRTGFVF